MRALWLPEALQDHGVRIQYIDGWQNRGKEMDGFEGDVVHHTACAPPATPTTFTPVTPSLNVVINGRPDVPGPLCNVLTGRDLIVRIVAAGRANHSGLGGWLGITSSRWVLGNEVEHCGYASKEVVRDEQLDVIFRVSAAFADGGGYGTEHTCQHQEWAPSRKIDFVAALVSGTEIRNGAARYRGGGAAPKPPTSEDWFDMATAAELEAVVRKVVKDELRNNDLLAIDAQRRLDRIEKEIGTAEDSVKPDADRSTVQGRLTNIAKAVKNPPEG